MMKAPDTLVAVMDALPSDHPVNADPENISYLAHDRYGVRFSSEALCDVLEWATEHPEEARALTEKIRKG